MENTKITVNAMMEGDMEKFLKKNWYWGALKDGYLKCSCGGTVTEENLTGIRKRDGRLIFYDSIICLTSDDHESRN